MSARQSIIAVAALGMILMSAGTSPAEPSNDLGTSTESEGAKSTTSIGSDPVCEEARKKTNKPGPCETQITLRVWPVKWVSTTPHGIGSDQESQQGVTVEDALEAGRIGTLPWDQTIEAKFFGVWKEKHSGTFFFDGNGNV
ncbi:hypothetical protein [Salininema proteolyticum]|uniref:Uncharacterized protein n=1 Tax=Salininema proteolyticum TaxID=1607685 RepID=A0ABV8TYK7_9ACTN